MWTNFALLLSVLFLVFAPDVLDARGHYYNPHDDRAIELAEVKQLTFRKDALTTGRRTSAVPQLSCVGGGACGTYGEPAVVHCTNIGTDYANGDPTWKCTAELENGLRLGTTDVVCEGFRDRDDPYILRGSCGLEYTLLGSPVKGHQQHSGHSSYQQQSTYQQHSTSRGSWFKWIVGGFFVWVCWRYLTKPFRGYRAGSHVPGAPRHTAAATGQQSYFGGGNFGGGGGWGHWGNWGETNKPNDNNAGGGRFWQGLGLGTAAGYLFGNRNRNNNYNENNNTWGGWFRQREPHHVYPTAAHDRPPVVVVDSAPATQTATGYGNTKRREETNGGYGDGNYGRAPPPPPYNPDHHRDEPGYPSTGYTRDHNESSSVTHESTGYGTTRRRG